MVDVKAAAKVSSEYLLSIQDMLESPIQELTLEEVEISEDQIYWLTTLGYNVKISEGKSNLLATTSLPDSVKPELQRRYKIFKINREN